MTDWKAIARSLFAGFSGQVISATVTISSGQSGYNPATGKANAVTGNYTVPMVPYGSKFKFSDPDLWKAGDISMLAGTYDLVGAIPNGATVAYTDPTTGAAVTGSVIQVEDQSAGTGASVILHLRRNGGA